MKIQVEIDIFDDPEYCDNNDSCCYWIRSKDGKTFCFAFQEFMEGFIQVTKCDQCKTAYQQTKGE